MFYGLAYATSFLASVLRLGAGVAAHASSQAAPIILYEFEGCPFCRFAREAVSQSGAPALIRPCPKGGKRFRPAVRELGGKSQFPYLVDPNNDVKMYESEDIAAYLHKTYGGKRSLMRFLGPINIILSQMGVLARAGAGTFKRRASMNAAPLQFYGAERDPGARLVKETLCEMELEYVWRARGAASPMLVDPNKNQQFIGGQAIRRYLKKAYKA